MNSRSIIILCLIGLSSYFVISCITIIEITYSEFGSKWSDWLGFIGALIGGLISGLLTLLGVRYTIKENRKKDLRDSLPSKLLYLEDILMILTRQYELLLKSGGGIEDGKANFAYNKRISYIVEYLEEDNLLKNSAKVNIITYQAVRRLYNALKQVYSAYKILPHEKINDAVNVTILTLEKERDKLVEDIDN